MAEYHSQMLKEIDYKDNPDAKPPYSYAALICLSMKDTRKKMTLSQIYKWIRDNFAYYRKADKSWQVRWRRSYFYLDTKCPIMKIAEELAAEAAARLDGGEKASSG